MVTLFQCISPEWFTIVNQWFVDNIIDATTMVNAINWMIRNELAGCEQLRFIVG